MGESIMVGVDIRREEDSRDAIALGAALSRARAAELDVVHVFEPGSGERPDPAELGRMVELVLPDAPGRPHWRARIVDAASPARALQELAAADGVLAIVVAAGRTSPGYLLPESVSSLLLNGGTHPIAVTPHGFAAGDQELRTVGVGFHDTPEGHEALGAAADLAARAGARLRVLSVFEPLMFSHIAMEEHEGLAVEHDLRERAGSALEAALAGLRPEVRAEGRLLEGASVAVLVRASKELDLLVLGSRGYGAENAVLLGPVSRRLLHEAACPVMIVPRGYRPPHAASSGAATTAPAAA